MSAGSFALTQVVKYSIQDDFFSGGGTNHTRTFQLIALQQDIEIK